MAPRRQRMDAASGWVQVATASIPGQAEPLRLVRRDDAFAILVGAAELMHDKDRRSEEALGRLGCAALRDVPDARVLIGGLGMGFTLRAALDALGPSARVVVSELVPAVVAWARGPLAPLFRASLDDPRVEIRVEDVARTIQSGPARFDAILLDVDNGPEGLTRGANDGLYDRWGLKRARYALRPGGLLAVWSGAPDRRFKARLRTCGFDVHERRVAPDPARPARDVLWLGTRPAAGW